VKSIRVPPHTAQSLRAREIPAQLVETTVTTPDAVVPGYEGRDVYMRRYHDAALDQEMLLRVIVEESETELVIVTAYKTSQIARYLKGV
jgi:hypothetical protein